MWIKSRISRQIMVVVALSFTLFFLATTLIIGYQYYDELLDLMNEQTESSAKLFKSDFEDDISRTENALASMEGVESFRENLALLNQYGPLYQEDDSDISGRISEAEQTYYFQSQLQLVSTLIALIPQYGLSHLAVYQINPFPQNNHGVKLLSFLIDNEYIWFVRYLTKSESPKKIHYRIPISEISMDNSLFNVSDVYGKDTRFFLDKIGVEETDEEIVDYLNALSIKDVYKGKSTNIVSESFSVAIWMSISLSMSNPKTWEKELRDSAIILGVNTPTKDSLSEVGNRIGSEFAIVEGDHAWVSGINVEAASVGHNIKSDYVLSRHELDISNFDGRHFSVMARTSKVNLKKRTINLILKLSLVATLILLVTGICIYVLINMTLNTPLNSLLKGVQSIESGNLDHKVEILGKNELTRISTAFNKMVDQIYKTSQELKLANEGLEMKVNERTNELVEAQQQLIMSEKMASLGQLVAGVAHEINTPLGNSITALSFTVDEISAIKKSFKDNSLKISDFEAFISNADASMELVQLNLRKASELVQTFKRVAVNQSVEELVTFSLLDQIEEVIKTLEPTLKKTKVNISLSIDSTIVIHSYPGSFYHIVSNLIMNSLVHAFPEKSGNIMVAVDQADERINIVFKDDGAGMSEDTSNKIFDPFYTTKRGAGGTGLGMYMTYNIVTQRLGGTIEVESVIDKGTTFIISIPTTPPQKSSEDGTFMV